MRLCKHLLQSVLMDHYQNCHCYNWHIWKCNWGVLFCFHSISEFLTQKHLFLIFTGAFSGSMGCKPIFFFFFFLDSFQTLKDHSIIWMSIWVLLAFYSEEGSKLLYVELLKHEVICSWRLVHIYLSDWWFWYEQWQIVLYLLSLKKIFKNKK